MMVFLGKSLNENINLFFNFSKKIIFNENKLRSLAYERIITINKARFF